ncbi:Replication termination factor 2 [Mycoemilia scoparia]|uniref:Replication termination factor 2 n=1 Tax=Mycoemilia scoparia TaxID=417184 RepID=A0A9W8A3S1_9FUNG|nr:Replication termination factor 2 [Mycoemilia scoparia]
MGNDGGSIPLRRELVKEKTKEEKADQRIQTITLWFYCALSKQPLKEPIVADHGGKLYNRESILEFLLDRKNAYGDADTICPYLKSLKDVKTLKLTRIASNEADKKPNIQHDIEMPTQFICPLTMREMNGRYPFVFLWSCGCVFLEKALAELKSTECPVCNEKFTQSEIVPINPLPEKQKSLIDTWKAQKKSSKRKKSSHSNEKSDSDGKKSSPPPKDKEDSNKRIKKEKPNSSVKINGTSVSRILEKYSTKNSALDGNAAIKGIFIDKSAPATNDSNFICKNTFNRYA